MNNPDIKKTVFNKWKLAVTFQLDFDAYYILHNFKQHTKTVNSYI